VVVEVTGFIVDRVKFIVRGVEIVKCWGSVKS
jgi:hypothetical protein